MSFAEQARDVWWILVLLGAGCLIAEWLLYGRKHGLPQTSAGPGLPAGDLFPAEAAAQPAEQRRAS